MKNRTKSQPASQSSRKEKLAAIMKKLEDGVHDLFTSENYRNYLKTMSQFHQYSFNNSVLIYLQNPKATRVASYTKWKDSFGQQVKKGEHGLS